MIENHHLYPFDPDHEDLELSKPFAPFKSAADRATYHADGVGALNDERATQSRVVTDSGFVMTTNWARIVPVIKEFAPEWQATE